MRWYSKCLRNYATFSGRAGRREYWTFILINFAVFVGLAFVDNALFGEDTSVLASLYVIGVLLPSLAVSVRRLHDTGRSGWWLAVSFVPLVGPLLLAIFYFLEGDPLANRYGPPPKPSP